MDLIPWICTANTIKKIMMALNYLMMTEKIFKFQNPLCFELLDVTSNQVLFIFVYLIFEFFIVYGKIKIINFRILNNIIYNYQNIFVLSMGYS